MIRQLLSHFETYPKQFCNLSLAGKNNLNLVSNLSFYYANKALMFFTLAWIGNIIVSYRTIALRPIEAFEAVHITGRLIMSSFPSPTLFYLIGTLAIVSTLLILFWKDFAITRFVLTLCLIWLSLLQWSYGKQSAVNNIFLLSHLFGIFIPFKYIAENKFSIDINKCVQWFYLGVLATYTFSGLWKWIGLVYKLVLKPDEVSWLSPVGALYTALTGFRNVDYPIDGVYQYYSHPLFWQVSFLLMTFILSCSFLAAYRQPLRIWAGISLIIFHLVNAIAFDVWSYGFHTAIFVLICLFFPYELVVRRISRSKIPIAKVTFYGKGLSAKYVRYYSELEYDEFFGFYAYRERISDKFSLIGGILFTPFLSLIVEFVWLMNSKLKYLIVGSRT